VGIEGQGKWAKRRGKRPLVENGAIAAAGRGLTFKEVGQKKKPRRKEGQNKGEGGSKRILDVD